jgi:hypothetical protein
MDAGLTLSALLAAVDARAFASEADNWGAAATDAAMAAYLGAVRTDPACDSRALAAMIPLGALARATAAEAAALVRDDPAYPELETRCWAHLAELETFAAVFAPPPTAAGAPPPPMTAALKEYRALCAARTALHAAACSDGTQALWRFLRSRRAAARGRPPPHPRPRTPLADNNEYYELRRRN